MNHIRLAVAALVLVLSSPAIAHPHSFIDMQTEIQSQGATLSGFKMSWTMDEITSADLLYDAGDAPEDAEIWKKLAAEVMANVLGQHYFSELYQNGKPLKFENRPSEYRLYREGNKVRLVFVLPLAHPAALNDGSVTLSTFDPTYYVDMAYPDKNSITLPDSLKGQCETRLMTPNPNASLKSYALSLDKEDSPGEDEDLGQQFAQKVTLECR
nr:DUF1007 family protein [Biostraticola tofi]